MLTKILKTDLKLTFDQIVLFFIFRTKPLFRQKKQLGNILKGNTWSLLFQKGTQVKDFAIFSVFCDSRRQYWFYDHVVYIFFHLQNIARATFVRNGFFIWRLENFFETREVASQGKFSKLT